MIGLYILDILISVFLVAPLVVGFWCGVWEYINYFSHVYPVYWTLYTTIALHIVFTLLREPLYEHRRPGLWGGFGQRMYIYLFGVVGVAQWHSSFLLLDQLTDASFTHLLTLIGVGGLVAINGVGTLVGPPLSILMDNRSKDVFIYPTMFKVSSTENVWIYLVDCVFSVCVVGSLVVFVWRGTWVLLDMFLYPGDMHSSALASVVVGYGIVGITFALQPPMKYLAKKLSGVSRIIVVDIYLLFSFCGTVNVWRGIWGLLNLYLLPVYPAASAGITHAVSFLLLVLINASNSVLVRGVYIDGEESGAQCVDFPCYYLRLFYQTKRKKKLLRQAEKRQSVRSRSEGEGLMQVGVVPIVEADWKKSANHSHPEILTH